VIDQAWAHEFANEWIAAWNGDRLCVSNGDAGTVVASLDTAEYSDEYPKENGAEPETGIMVIACGSPLPYSRLAAWAFGIVPTHIGEDREHLLHSQVGFMAQGDH
jgi:hypothetical protein